MLFYGGQTLQWGAQIGCGASILGDLQNPTGYSSEHPALVCPEEGVRADGLQRFLPRDSVALPF